MATAALIVSVLAIVVGLGTVALAAAPALRENGVGGDGPGSLPRLGRLCLITGGCLLMTGGLCFLLRLSTRAPALRSEAQARLQFALLEPLEALTVQVRGPDPFHGRGQPGACALRLRLDGLTGSALISELPASCLLPAQPAGTDGDAHEYIIAWPALIEGATTEEGRTEAGRICQLNDLRRFERVEAAILGPSEDPATVPGLLQIVTRTEHVVELFNGSRSYRRKEYHGAVAASAWIYNDEKSYISFRDRLTGWKALERYWPSQTGFNAVLAGLLGAGVLVLAIGLERSGRGNWVGLELPAALPRVPAWVAPAFVWVVWALMFAASLTFVWRFAHNIPNWDDWPFLVPFVTSHRSITPSYLWQQDVEHRYPLTKVVGLGVIMLAGGDFRAIPVFKMIALGGMAVVLILVARRLRGWTSFTDAFLPLALIPVGFSIPMCACWATVAYFIPTLIATPLLLIAVSKGTHLTFGSAMLAGGVLALLPLCSAAGVLYLPALTLWLCYSAIQTARSPLPGGKRIGLVILGWIGVTVIIAALYFNGYNRGIVFAPARPGPIGIARTWLAFLAGSYGDAASSSWPYSGLLMLTSIVLTTGVLVFDAWRHEDSLDRSRAIGTLFALGSIATVALGISWGRSGFGFQMGFQYKLLALPIIWCTYFAWGLYPRRVVAQSAQAILLLIACASAAVNLPAQFAKGREEDRILQAFERDILDGSPPYVALSRRYHEPPAPIIGNGALDGTGLYDKGIEFIRMLKFAGNSVFRHANQDPPFDVLPVPLDPIEVGDWEDSPGRVTRSNCFRTFRLPRPVHVAAIRIRCKTSQPEDRPVSFAISWKGIRDRDFPPPQFVTATFPLEPLTVAVADTIDQIRVYPNRLNFPVSPPFDSQIEQIEVLFAPETIGIK